MAALVRWEPAREMVSLTDVMDRLFSQAFVRPFDTLAPYWDSARAMPINVTENKDDFIVTAAVPGIKTEDLDVSIEDNTVTIRAEQKGEQPSDGHNVHIRELYTGKLERCFTLPVQVDASKAKAELEHGVLTLTLPKAEEVKPKSIQVQAK